MELSRLAVSDRLIIGGAVLFLIGVSRPWYGTATGAYHGWHYVVTGWVPFVVSLAMAALALVRWLAPKAALPEPRGGWGPWQRFAGLGVFGLILLRALVPGHFGTNTLDRKYGLLLALAAAGMLAAGGWLQARRPAPIEVSVRD